MNIPSDISSNDFFRLFEKKLRKEIRYLELSDVEIVDTNDSNYFVLKHFLKEKLKIHFKEGGLKLYPSSMDEKGRDLLKVFLERKSEKKTLNEGENKGKGGQKEVEEHTINGDNKEERIPMLASFTQEEIDRIAKMLGYEGKGRDKDEIIKMMDKLDERFKNIKTSLVKSADAIKNVLEKERKGE